MINYKLGCNFDFTLIDEIYALNEKYKDNNVRINELYGSDRQHSFLTARPPFRLPEIAKERFEDYIHQCNGIGVEFNYTLNAINPGSKRFLHDRKQEIIEFIQYLQDIGVARVTVANLLMAEFVREASSTIGMEISTIMHVDAVSQIKWLYENFKIDKICGSILKNRNIQFLTSAAALCKQLGVKYEILANEFCGNGGGSSSSAYGTHCSLRDHCYICHNSNQTKEDAELMNTYPMGYCMSSRNDPASWLKMRFVLPQDVDKYAGIGITNFKISGRTGTTEYLAFVAEAYMSKNYRGNLLALWKQLETIYTGQNEMEFKQPYIIDCGKLSDEHFLDYWFDENEQRCEEEICGDTCTYCNDIYELIKKD